jgi:hypothetical protein
MLSVAKNTTKKPLTGSEGLSGKHRIFPIALSLRLVSNVFDYKF